MDQRLKLWDSKGLNLSVMTVLFYLFFSQKICSPIHFLLQPLRSCLQYSVTNYTLVLNNTDRDTGREIGPFMFSEEQERAQIFMMALLMKICTTIITLPLSHYHYHIRAYNRIGFNDSGTRVFSKWITEVGYVTVYYSWFNGWCHAI